MYGTKINSTVKSLNNFVKAFFMQLIDEEKVIISSDDKSPSHYFNFYTKL